MTEQVPNLDVIIPVLNGGKTIEAAIDSALNQIGVKVRVIVVDAGSSDGTINVVNSLNDPRIQLISGNGTLMTGEARNLGIAASASTWIGLLDADDLWPHERSQQLLRVISDPDNEISVGHMITFPDGADVDPSRQWPLTGSHLAPIPGGVLISRSVFDRVGRFDGNMRVGEFIDWMARARGNGIREIATEKVVLLRRNHENNTSRTRKDDYGSSILSIALKQRARQRAMSSELNPPSDSDT
jgi:glycosyltransferase involved in cell wall biosynthesis